MQKRVNYVFALEADLFIWPFQFEYLNLDKGIEYKMEMAVHLRTAAK